MKIKILLLMAVFFMNDTYAVNFVCGADLNNNGDTADAGETASCKLISSKQFCEVGAQVCDIKTTYKCSENNIVYNESTQCNISCSKACQQMTVQYTCPTSGHDCINNNGIMQCAPHACIDLDLYPPEVEEETDPIMQIDDGNRNSDGACMDQSFLFSGRNLRCDKAGVSTSFKNCCKPFDKVLQDNTGSINSTHIAIIKGTFDAMSAAYNSYVAAGGTVNTAINAGVTSIQGSLSSTLAFDPYSIMLSLAINYLMQGCGQQDMEVGMLNSSGYCVEVGEYCRKKWKFVGCVQKSKTYCCFNSKLARIIQQQGRSQLGMTFGNTESPNCSGFTPVQFQNLDFGKIDLSEYYGDLQNKSQNLINESISTSVEDYYNQINYEAPKH